MFPHKQTTVDTRPTGMCVNIAVDTHPWAVIVTETMSGRPMRDAGPLHISPAGAEDARGPNELEELEGSHVVFRLREEKRKNPSDIGCYFSGLRHIILHGLCVNVTAIFGFIFSDWIRVTWQVRWNTS